MFNKSNFKEWFDRYKYAEISATTAVLASSQFSRIFDGLTTAYLITFSEYFAFYTVIFLLTYNKLAKKNEQLNTKTTWKDVGLLVRNLILEFGYPAAFDIFLIRPFFMYWMPMLTGNYFIGILLGKIAADSFFYSLTIVNYELIKRKK
jgi:Na+/H+ antiporter NhaC